MACWVADWCNQDVGDVLPVVAGKLVVDVSAGAYHVEVGKLAVG